MNFKNSISEPIRTSRKMSENFINLSEIRGKHEVGRGGIIFCAAKFNATAAIQDSSANFRCWWLKAPIESHASQYILPLFSIYHAELVFVLEQNTKKKVEWGRRKTKQKRPAQLFQGNTSSSKSKSLSSTSGADFVLSLSISAIMALGWLSKGNRMNHRSEFNDSGEASGGVITTD